MVSVEHLRKARAFEAMKVACGNAHPQGDTLAYDASPIASELANSRSPDPPLPACSGGARPILHRCSAQLPKGDEQEASGLESQKGARPTDPEEKKGAIPPDMRDASGPPQDVKDPPQDVKAGTPKGLRHEGGQ